MAPVLVTGASGFIGSALVAALRASGSDVFVVDIRPFPDASVPGVVGDLRDPGVVAAAFSSRPSAVFHLAARTSVLQSLKDPQGVFDVNVDITQRLLEGARAAGTGSFVFASTNAVVGETNGVRIDEDVPLRPLTPYGATKAAAEMVCSAYASSYDMAVCPIRFTNVYGHGMGNKDTFVIRLMRAAATTRPALIYGDGLQERDYLHVDDAVGAMILAQRKGVRGPLVVGTGHSTSVVDLCQMTSDVVGAPIETTHVDPPAGEMRAVRVDITRARSLGYEPRFTLPVGLALTWKALRHELDQPASSPAPR
ncbi:MAG TPA: NAD-dependent epimerase/dehydratase family protein [Acidimicrobiia bacterium]